MTPIPPDDDIAAARGGRLWFVDPPDGSGVVAVLAIAAVTGHDPARNAGRPSEEGRRRSGSEDGISPGRS